MTQLVQSISLTFCSLTYCKMFVVTRRRHNSLLMSPAGQKNACPHAAAFTNWISMLPQGPFAEEDWCTVTTPHEYNMLLIQPGELWWSYKPHEMMIQNTGRLANTLWAARKLQQARQFLYPETIRINNRDWSNQKKESLQRFIKCSKHPLQSHCLLLPPPI